MPFFELLLDRLDADCSEENVEDTAESDGDSGLLVDFIAFMVASFSSIIRMKIIKDYFGSKNRIGGFVSLRHV